MLRVYKVDSQDELNQFISNTMSAWNQPDARKQSFRRDDSWMFAQPDCDKVNFPAQFVIVAEQKVRLATIQFLH